MKRMLAGVVLATFVLFAPAEAAPPSSAVSLHGLVRDRTGVELAWSPDGQERQVPSDTTLALLRDGLTVERAVRIALLNSRTLEAEFEEVGISRADYRQAVLAKNPTIEANVRIDGARRPGELIVMQDLSSILLAPMRRQAASAMLQQATFRAAHMALGVARETRAAFYGVQAAEQIRRFWEQTVAVARAASDLAQRQQRAGNIADLDLENQQALYEQARLELSSAQADGLAAREALNRAMGTWGDQIEWQVVGDLPAPPPDTTGLAGLESRAISQRLDLAAAEAEVRALEKSVSLSRFAQFPELRAGVHFEREPDGTHVAGPALELAIPLFDRGQHSVARTQAQLRQARDRHAALAVEIRSEVRTARSQLTAARERAEYYHDVVLPRRARIVEQTQREYNFMLAGVFQLLQAKQSEIDAQREFLEARRDYWVARTELEHALGGSLMAASAR